MANEEQLAILKKGVRTWNAWREAHSDVVVDLMQADLRMEQLEGAMLSGALLIKSNLSGADLQDADLMYARFTKANLTRANLSGAVLMNASLDGAFLRQANLVNAGLNGSSLRGADLAVANFTQASLGAVDLTGAKLAGTILSRVNLGGTVFAGTDLSVAVGLSDVWFGAPSHISEDTLALSRGHIPEVFLRGCGFSDWEIEQVKLYKPDLTNDEISKILYRVYDLRASQALQISPLFISYSHADGAFMDKISDYLTEKGIRYWRDIHDMKAGRMEKQIDRAIRQNPTVLLVLSEHSLRSDWVEHEVRTARELERELDRDVLCPVALDDSWKDSRWPKRLMEQVMEYNILDFSDWENGSTFDGTFTKLVDGLKIFYGD